MALSTLDAMLNDEGDSDASVQQKTSLEEKGQSQQIDTLTGPRVSDKGRGGEEGTEGATAKEEVDYKSRYNEEKGWRTRIQSELKEAKAALQEFDSFKRELLRIKEARDKEEAKPKSDPQEDPVQYLTELITNKMKETRDEIDAIKSHLSGNLERDTQRSAAEDLLSKAQRSSVAYAKENPEYQEAIQHLEDVRTKELHRMGYDDNEVAQIIMYDVLNITKKALDNDVNPAEVFMDLAKMRGWAGKNSTEEMFRKKKQGQRQSVSLSQVSGAKARDIGIQLGEIDSLSNDEFDSLWQRLAKGE